MWIINTVVLVLIFGILGPGNAQKFRMQVHEENDWTEAYETSLFENLFQIFQLDLGPWLEYMTKDDTSIAADSDRSSDVKSGPDYLGGYTDSVGLCLESDELELIHHLYDIVDEMLEESYREYTVILKDLSSEGISKFTNAKRYFQSLCANNIDAKNNETEAYETLLTGIKNFRPCLQSMPDSSTKLHEDNGEMHVCCKARRSLEKCVKDFTNSIKSCLGPEKRKSIDRTHKISDLFMRFTCDNSKLLEDAVTSLDYGCLFPKLISFVGDTKPCGALGFNITERFSEALNDPRNDLSRFQMKYNCQETREVENFEKCTVDVLKECNNKASANVLSSFSKYIRDPEDCELPIHKAQNLVESTNASRANPTGASLANSTGASTVNYLHTVLLLSIPVIAIVV